MICVRFDDDRKSQFGHAVLLISYTDVVCCIPPSWLFQFVKLHLFLPKPLHMLLYYFGDCAHHPAGYVICAQLTHLCILIILFYHILLIVGTCTIAQTCSDVIEHLWKHYLELSGCQSRGFSFPHIFLLLINRCLCIFNPLSCHSGFSLNMILDSCLWFFFAFKVRSSSFLHCKLLFG